jgi:hypothetical protein
MDEEEKRRYEADKIIHNKIAKEFQMKAKMRAKLRKLQQRMTSDSPNSVTFEAPNFSSTNLLPLLQV